MNCRHFLVALSALLMLPAVSSAQIITPPGQTKLLLDFEDPKIWKSENDSPFGVKSEQVSQGKASLKVNYTNKPVWSTVYTDRAGGDWSQYKYLNVDIYLEGDEPVNFGMWVRDSQQHKAETQWQIGPGWNTVTMDFAEMKKKAGLDLTQTKGLCLYKSVPQEIVVHIDNMYLSMEKPVPPKAEPVKMPAKELLENGGFEKAAAPSTAPAKPDDITVSFADWTSRRWSGPSFLGAGKKAVASGQSSLMLDGRGPCKIGVYGGKIRIQSPTKLKLTAMIQGSGLKKGTFGQIGAIIITDFAEKPLAGARIDVPAGTFAWKKAEVVFDVPAKTPIVKVFIQLLGEGLLWVDDVSLTGCDLDAKTGLTVGQSAKELVADEPLVTESPQLQKKKQAVQAALAQLKATVAAAQAKGLETLYDEIPFVLADLAFNVRWDLPDHLVLRDEYCQVLTLRAQEATAHLQQVIDGKLPDIKVPPHPDFSKLKLEGGYFTLDGKPRPMLAMEGIAKGELTRWFTPTNHTVFLPAVGATRYDFQKTPIWDVYQKNPDTRRIYDNTWCGHIIRDQYSAGGDQMCVISLDSPLMREAIAQSIATKGEAFKKRPDIKNIIYLNMGFEYAYRNYDDASARLFRKWLTERYGEVAKLNETWKTAFKSFDEVTAPDYAPGKHEPNPSKRYDWGEFNLWRFTDYMTWARAEIKKHVDLPATTGGGNPFGAHFWSDGMDEESLMAAGAIDFWLSETGSRALGVTSLMDLQRSFDNTKLILDPEYHALPNTAMLMYLHGCGIMHFWWWPDGAGEFYESSMKHSSLRTLDEVGIVMRAALDLRRLGSEVASFRKVPTEIGLLYSRASLVQEHPGAAGVKTPYTFEVEKSYQAASRLDAGVGFASTKQVLAGGLDKYKMLVVPGARFVADGEFKKIIDFVKAGGTLVITPTSLIADQYNRKRNYLQELGIEITAEELPEMMAGAAVRGIDQEPGEMDFIQGPVAKTIVTKEPKRKLIATAEGKKLNLPAEMSGEGVIQTVSASKDWTTLAAYAGADGLAGDAGLLVRSLGKGKVYYMAAQLPVTDRRSFFDRLMDDSLFTRPVRMLSVDGQPLDEVESRTIEQDGHYLTYLHNLSSKPQTVQLKSSKPMSIFSLSSQTAEASEKMTLSPYETKLLKIEVKK